MINANLQKAIKFIFLPALLLSVLLSLSGTLFHLSQNDLIGFITIKLGVHQILALKAATILPQIVLAFSLLIFSIYKPFEKVFRGTLLILIGIIALSAVFMFFQEHLELKEVSETLGIYKPLVAHWPISLMYIVLNVVQSSLYSLFIWGFINRLASLSEGIKYYIPLILVLGIAGIVMSNLGLMMARAYEWSLIAKVIPAIGFTLCSLFIFNWSWKRLPESLIHPQDESPILQPRFPFLNAAYLLAAGMIVKKFLEIILKSYANTQFPDINSYSTFMSYYLMFVGNLTSVISVIFAILGTWLILKKGWRATSLSASISLLVGAIAFLSYSSSSQNLGIFTALLTSTTNVLFFPLVQILYLYLPYQKRFKSKIVTEMIALPILQKFLPSVITQGLLVIFGSIAAIAIYLKILVPILMALLIFVSYRSSLRFAGIKIKT